AGSARGPATNRIVPSGVGHRVTAQERAVQRRSRTASSGQAAVVLIAHTSGHRGVCVRCCSHHLEIAYSSAHDSLSRSQPQFVRLVEALMEWNPAVAPQLDKCASQLGTATKAGRPCSRKGSEEQQRASLGTAASVHVGEVMLVHLPPHAAAAFPAWANCLYALSLHMTSWQPPAEDAASVPAILLQLTPLSTLGAAGAGAGQQVLDSVRSVQEAVACLGPPALPTGPLVAGLSGRLLRLVSTLDALPSLVTLCTVEGQILYQNSSSLHYTGSPAARAAAAKSQHRPGSVKSSGSFLADLLQLQPELVEEVLETVVVGSDVWSQVVRVPELLAVEVPSNTSGARRASVCLTRSATVLSAAAEASMAHAMGMLMVTPALAAATTSFSAGQQSKARLQQQGATPLTQLQTQQSGMNKHPSLPSAPAAAQAITPRCMQAAACPGQAPGEVMPAGSSSPCPGPTQCKPPVLRQPSHKTSSSWLTQSLGVARGSHQLTKPSCSSPALPVTISHSAIRASTQELPEARRPRTSLDLGVMPGSPHPSTGQALTIHPTTTSQTGSRLG
ncbi:guanylate cyclase domain-containing protein, partial [Haematococcus lacustris]